MEVMHGFPEETFDLIFTSPPYNCGKKYDGYEDKLSQRQYWAFTRKWVEQSMRTLKTGGRLVVNLPWWMGKKPRTDVEYEFKKVALNEGFLFIDKIIWIKGGEENQPTSGSGWGTYLSPSGPAIRCVTEPILVFAKGSRGRGVTSDEGRGLCVRGDVTKDEWMKWTKDAWFVPGKSNKDHPAVFPLEVATRIIKLYTFPGDTVLDPFVGSGTVLLASQELGRVGVGIDVSEKYVQYTRDRVGQQKLV